MEKSHQREASYSAVPVGTYKYDEAGNIVNSNITFYGMPASPMKYRDLKSRRSEVPRTCRSPSLPRSNPDLSFKSKLSVNIYTREVYVVQDGSCVSKDSIPGFYHKFSLIKNFDRASHSEEMKAFYTHCKKMLKSQKEFKFLFNSNGKVLRCLHELPHDEKIVLVSCCQQFSGLSSTNDFKEKNSEISEDQQGQNKAQVMENLQNRFKITRGKSRYSSFHEKVVPGKIQNLVKEKLDFNSLKIKLGNDSYKIDKIFPTLCSQGLKRIKEKYSFSEGELHNLYGKFKLLVLLSCGMEKNHKISSGISKRTFVDYYSKSPELSNILTKIFEKFDTDGGGTVSWEEYLDAMHVIWHGTIEDQLDFFFSVYDDDGNGCLSFKEIQELCRLQLQMDKADGLLDELSYSFASLIFDLTETSYTEDVPSYKIKEIIRKQQDKSLIEMFCSFNCLKIFFLWVLFYFLQVLNFIFSEWARLGLNLFRVSFKVLQLEFFNGKKINLWQALDEMTADDEYDQKWVEKFKNHLEAGIGLIILELVSLLFLVLWEKMKYYKNLEDWKSKEKILVFFSVFFKVLSVGFWWGKTRSALNTCDFLVIGEKLQSPCVSFGFGLQLCLSLMFIINILISISL